MSKYTVGAMIPERVTFTERHDLAPLVKRANEARDGGSNDEELGALWDLVERMLWMLNIMEEG